MIWTTNFSNYTNVYCNVIRVIRAIRSLVDSVFVLKYVIEVYVSMSFCLRAIRIIRSLVAFVFVQKYVIEVYVSMSFCLLSHSVCQMFSQPASQSGTNSVRINGFLACKRCPLRRLLTPFWSPIKHLLKSVFATTWQQETYRDAEITCFYLLSLTFPQSKCKENLPQPLQRRGVPNG